MQRNIQHAFHTPTASGQGQPGPEQNHTCSYFPDSSSHLQQYQTVQQRGGDPERAERKEGRRKIMKARRRPEAPKLLHTTRKSAHRVPTGTIFTRKEARKQREQGTWRRWKLQKPGSQQDRTVGSWNTTVRRRREEGRITAEQAPGRSDTRPRQIRDRQTTNRKGTAPPCHNHRQGTR